MYFYRTYFSATKYISKTSKSLQLKVCGFAFYYDELNTQLKEHMANNSFQVNIRFQLNLKILSQISL